MSEHDRSSYPNDPHQLALPCLFMRGGSSRGGFFLDDDLPRDPRERSAVLLACYGSPDVRQIDGIGGADPLTSKAAIVARSQRDDADLDYTFCQIGISEAKVSMGGSCGNMLSAMGPFGLLRDLIIPTEPVTEVRIFTTNTGQVVTVRFPVRNGVPVVDGDCVIAGVPDAGARIDLDFGDCSGAVSGRLLPTGNPVDTIIVDSRTARVSLVDAATPFAFVAASDIGAMGHESAEEMAANIPLMQRLEAVRGWAAVQMGFVENESDARAMTPNIPRVMMVAASQGYTTPAGRRIGPDECDLAVRQLSMQRPHKALAVTGSICAAVAAAIPGSLPASLLGARKGADIRLGHPSGVIRVGAVVTIHANGRITVESARIERSARLLMAGTVYARKSAITRLAASIEG